jgi:hypothetical protein
MRKYLSGLIGLSFAILLVASIKRPIANVTFFLKPGVDLTSCAAITNKANWVQCEKICGGDDIPCTITVDESFTHLDSFPPPES